MCTTRCDILHDKAEGVIPPEESRQLREDIKEQHLLVIVEPPPGYLYLLYKPLEATLNISALKKNKWLRSENISREEDSTEGAYTLTRVITVLC